MMTPVPRRKFIKGLFLGAISSASLSNPWSRLFASEVSLSTTGIISINIQDYPPLATDLGSIRLGVNPITPGPLSFPQGAYWPIIISRESAGVLHCVNSKCKHTGCIVNAYTDFEGGLPCRCHGSLYAIDGSVLQGPARSPLDRYISQLEGNTLSIQVPGLGYRIDVSPASTESPRIRLSFHAYLDVNYEVRFREHLSDPWSTVPFSRTPEGAAEELILVGQDAPVTIYVDRTTPTGFYAASMQLLDLT